MSRENTISLVDGSNITLKEFKIDRHNLYNEICKNIEKDCEESDIKLNQGQKLMLSRLNMLMEIDSFTDDYTKQLFSSAPRLAMHVWNRLQDPCWIPEWMDPEIADYEEQHGCDSKEIERLSLIIPICNHKIE